MWLILSIAFAADPPAPSIRRTPVVIAVEKATPAVVSVDVEVEQQNPFFGWGSQLAAAAGSGVIIDSSGVVLTNAHVVNGAVNIRIKTSTGASYPASVIAIESSTDLAVLKAEGAKGLPVIEIGTSRDLMLGETAIAIGNPLGLGLTVSTGVVSSVERDAEIRPGVHQTFIQTDAAINRGNSGGALVNIEGKLIGINTWIRTDAQGIGFAIPVDRVAKIASDLVTFGSVRSPWLGVELSNADRQPVVIISGVQPEGPAAKVLRPGDIVASIDGHAVTSRADINSRLADRKPGDTVVIGYQRDGRAAQTPLASMALPADTGARVLSSVIGITCAPSSGGVAVASLVPQGFAAHSGLAVGDIVVAVSGVRIRSMADLDAALGALVGQHRDRATLTIGRGRTLAQLEIEL